jgi:purine-binding chemotaxis protein CheW
MGRLGEPGNSISIGAPMSGNKKNTDLWTIVTLDKELYALPLDNIKTMVALPVVTHMPKAPPFVRGVINLRGSVFPVVDLRQRLGMTSLKTEMDDLISMLSQREQDHKNWIDELEASVREKREFTLQTDHRKCAFGLWYESYTTDSLILDGLLKKFDTPHKRIHSIAHKVLELGKQDLHEEALKIINDTKNGDLSLMFQLFSSLRVALRESLREIVIIVSENGKSFAVVVDSVETVGPLAKGSIEDVANCGMDSLENSLIQSFGKRDKTGDVVMILDLSMIFPQEDPMVSQAEPSS